MGVDIRRLTAHLSPQQQAAVRKIYRQRAESSTTAFLLCFFLGLFGLHRFYLKQSRQGVLHLLLALAIAVDVVAGTLLSKSFIAFAIVGGLLLLIALLWVIVDLARIDDEVASHNLSLAEKLIAQTLLSDHSVEQQADAKLDSMLRETAAQADAAANYGRMQMDQIGTMGALSPSDTLAAAPIPAVGAVAAHYEATTVTHISDDPNDTQHGSQPAPETQPTAEPHSESSLETDTVSDMPDTAALAGVAGVAAAGAVLPPLVTEVVKQVHEVSAHSVTDGFETMTTASIPDLPQGEVAAAAPAAFDAYALPTTAESEAATWPRTLSDTPATPQWIAPDVTDRAGGTEAVLPVADIGAAGGLPLHVALDDAAPGAPAGDALLFLVPEEAPAAAFQAETPAEAYIPPIVPVFTTSADYPEPSAFLASSEPEVQPEPYAAAAVPLAYDAALEPMAVAPEPAPEPAPHHQSHLDPTLGEIGVFGGLASLTGLATSAAEEAVALSRAHRESASSSEATPPPAESSAEPSSIAPWEHAAPADQPESEPSSEPISVAPWEHAAPAQLHSFAEQGPIPSWAQPAPEQPETLAELAPLATPLEHDTSAAAEPVAEQTPASGEASPAAPVEAALTTGALAAATDAELREHHQLKRIRVVRQLKVDGKVVEETSAEEYIDIDADPEPVKARLRDQLRQQAQQRADASQGTGA